MNSKIESFPVNLRKLIDCLGITDKDFADRIGVSHTCISLILTGKRRPSTETLVKIHEATGCSVDKLFGLVK